MDGVWRILASRSLAVNSAGGAVTSTTSLSAQTYAVDLAFPATVASTTGCRFLISDMVPSAGSVSSTQGAFLPANWVQRYKCTPGQKVQAISNDGSAIPSLTIIELTK
jgi:hypothetical protein